MAYTKTTWKNNTTKLNATNMNHIEQGIADAFAEINKNTAAIEKKQDLTTFKTINGEVITGTGDIKTLDADALSNYYDKEEVNSLLKSEEPFTVNGEEVVGPEVRLNANAAYELSGVLHGHIIITGADKENTQIIFNNVTIKSDVAQAFYCDQAKSRTVITLFENTKNYIETPAIECSADNSEGALQAEDKLIIVSGENSELHVKAPGLNQHAIKGSKLLLNGAGSIFVEAGHDGFHGGKLLRIDSGNYFVISAAVDAIEAKLVQILGGNIHVYKYGKTGNAISSKESEGLIAGNPTFDLVGDEVQAMQHFNNMKCLDIVENAPENCPKVTCEEYFGVAEVYESAQKVNKDTDYGDSDGFPTQGWFDNSKTSKLEPDASGNYTCTKQYIYTKGYIPGCIIATVAKTKYYLDNTYIKGGSVTLPETSEVVNVGVWYHPDSLSGKLEVKGKENSVNYFEGSDYGMLSDRAIGVQEDANYIFTSSATAVKTSRLTNSYIFTKGDGCKIFNGKVAIDSAEIFFSTDGLDDEDLPNVFEIDPIIAKGTLKANKAIYIPYSQIGACILDTYDTRDLIKFDLPGFTTTQPEKAQVIVENKKELLNSLREKIYELSDTLDKFMADKS